MESFSANNPKDVKPENNSRRTFLKGVGALGAGALIAAKTEDSEAQVGFGLGYLFGESDGKKLPKSPMDSAGYQRLSESQKKRTLI